MYAKLPSSRSSGIASSLNLAIKKQRALNPNKIIGPHCAPKKVDDDLVETFFLVTVEGDGEVGFAFFDVDFLAIIELAKLMRRLCKI